MKEQNNNLFYILPFTVIHLEYLFTEFIMDEDLPESVKKCLDILDENVEILANLEYDLDDEKEDELTPDMELHNLYDMTEDVAESAKLKRAESNFARRQAEDSL